MKLKKRRAYVRGTITSTLNQLKEMFDPEATASPSESLVLSLISDIEETLKTVDEFTPAICFELDDELRDPWSFLEIVFVGQCEVFVCLGFV